MVMAAKDLKVGGRIVLGQPVEPLQTNTKRKTEDYLMVGLSPMAQQAFKEYQKILVESAPGTTHEQAIQELMKRAIGTEQVAAILEMSEYQKP